MYELIGARRRQDESGPHRFTQVFVHFFRVQVHPPQLVELGTVAQACKLMQRLLRLGKEAAHLPHHELHDVIAVALVANAIHVPGPSPGVMIEGQQTILRQRGDELHGKKWIARGLPVDESRQGIDALRFTVKTVHQHPSQLLHGQGRQLYLPHARAGSTDDLERVPQGVGGIYIVVAVGADQHQMAQIRLRQEILEHFEHCNVEPQQIVEKQRERVLLPREYPEEAPEDPLEAKLRFPRRKIRDRLLRSNDELELGNEIHDELTIRAQGLAKGVAPSAELRLALSQKRAHQTLEGLAERGVWNVALVLVELAGREEAARWNERFVQLVHHRGFADAGIAGYEHELRRTVDYDAVEGA